MTVLSILIPPKFLSELFPYHIEKNRSFLVIIFVQIQQAENERKEDKNKGAADVCWT